MLGFGVPIQDVTRFFRSPVIELGLENKWLRSGTINQLSANLYDRAVEKA